MDELGIIVSNKRKARGQTVDQLARALKCSVAFVRHIEGALVVPISPRLVAALRKHFGFTRKEIEPAAEKRNKIGSVYYREYYKRRKERLLAQ